MPLLHMRKLQRPLTIAWWSVVAWVSTAGVVHAATALDRLKGTGKEAGFKTDTGETTLALAIGRIINAAMGLLGVIFVAQMVYAGYLWMTASGEEEQLTKAKHIIRRSIVGLAIVLGAWAITRFVLSKFYLAVK